MTARNSRPSITAGHGGGTVPTKEDTASRSAEDKAQGELAGKGSDSDLVLDRKEEPKATTGVTPAGGVTK